MRAQRQVIHSEVFYLHRDLSYRLDGIAEDGNTAFAAGSSDLFHPLNRPDLVVGQHEADEKRIVLE